MNISANTIGAAINQYLMKAALPFGAYFILEYLVRNYSVSNFILGFLNIPMMLGTVIMLYTIIKRLRDRVLDGKISGFMAWTFGTQLMLFAGLIEAAFIYIYNEYIVPTNLTRIHTETIAQYEDVLAQLEILSNPNGFITTATETMRQSIDILKEAPVSTAIESAMTMLSNDIFIGMILMALIAPILRRK